MVGPDIRNQISWNHVHETAHFESNLIPVYPRISMKFFPQVVKSSLVTDLNKNRLK